MRRNFLNPQGIPTPLPSSGIRVLGLLLLYLLSSSFVTRAQTPPITSSGLNTQVSGPVAVGPQTQYNITGGTRPGGGVNLFHSFGQFNVANNNIANFLNETGQPTSNILGRVTGGNISNIFGAIQTQGFGNANLFLMNPSGFLFGPNATVNVGGMVSFTSADYLRLADGARFNAIPNAAPDGLLSAAPVAAFGFLGSNPGAITVQGSQFTVTEGTGILLVGGNITIQSGTLDNGTVQTAKLAAPGGQINLASVASPGEVSASDFLPSSGMTMGNINFSQGSKIDVSSDAAGTVRIRGGQFQIVDATISADTGNSNGAPTAVDIQVTGDMSISDTRGVPVITARTTGLGDAGEVRITSANLEATSTVASLFSPIDTHFALIDTHTSGSGKAGNVSIETGTLNATGQESGPMDFIDSGTIGPGSGQGGDITLAAKDINLTNLNITSGDLNARQLSQEAGGSGGNVTITADTLSMNLALIATDGFFVGRAGDITISARDVQLSRFSQLSLLEFGGGGALKITADRLIADSFQVQLETVDGRGAGIPWTGISITGSVVELRNGTTLRSQTVGDGNAGDIRISATDHLTLADRFSADPNDPTTIGAQSRPTGLFTNSLGNADLGTLGNAGSIIVNTPRLEVIGGARINSTTQDSGRGGNVTVTANQVTISGERPFEFLEEGHFGVGSTLASGIYTRTVGSEFCTGACGDAGHISITTSSLNLTNGGVINSGTASTGRGGDVSVHASDAISISGSLVDGTPGGIFSQTVGADPGSGNGGNIELHAAQFHVSGGAQISASTLGSGNAGNVTIEDSASSAQSVLIDGFGSGIFTDTQSTGAGGNILVNANTVTLQDGGTLSATTSGTGNGGEIQINAGTINLLGFASINTLSFLGDGSAGNIALKATQQITATDSFLNSDAVEGTGIGGTILLSSPTIRLNGAVLSTSTSGTGNAGNILLEGQQISLGASPSAATQGADLFASTSSSGQGGTITLRGLGGSSSYAENVTIAGNSRLHTVTSADGSAGDITIRVSRFALSDLSTLNADTFGSGQAGTITITATDSATISGVGSSVSSSSDFGATGNAGQITVAAPTVLIENGGLVSTSTTGEATGGNVNVAASNSVTMITGANISASSSGTGKAGNITINAGNQFAMTSSSVTTEANQSSGGAIKITTNPNGTVQLTNSMISASVLDGNGGGGSVNIDPQFVILQNSQVLANAVFGPGGNIFITTNLLLPDTLSLISASSRFGQQGTITVQSPISPASGKIVPLGQKPLLPTSLLSQRCAALAGGNISSFTIAGRDSLPAEPGGWVSTPLALSMFESEDGTVKEAGLGTTSNEAAEEIPLLSLRKIAPPGFLTQSFAVDSSVGCTS